jgi:hypothetical protein
VIEEFLLTINGSKFSIHFTPHSKSFAFVSAIEVFLIPDKDFVMDDIPLVTPAGSNETLPLAYDLRFYAQFTGSMLEVHRTMIHCGGLGYRMMIIYFPEDLQKTVPPYNGTLKYDVLGATYIYIVFLHVCAYLYKIKANKS